MKKSVSLLICLTALVAGVALEAPGDEPAVATGKCKEAKSVNCPAATTDADAIRMLIPAPFVCVQYPLYEEDGICLWAGDEYASNQTCNDYPLEVYFWTVSGIPGPQQCADCQAVAINQLLRKGKLEQDEPPMKGLPKALAQADNIHSHLPKVGTYVPGERRIPWFGKPGLREIAESKVILIKSAANQDIFVKLLSVSADFSKVDFPAGVYPPRPKIERREVYVGFECEKPAANPPTVPVDCFQNWKYHGKDKYRGTVEVEIESVKTTFHITTFQEIKFTALPLSGLRGTDKTESNKPAN